MSIVLRISAVVVLCCSLAFSQQLRGRVTSSQNEPVASALVRLPLLHRITESGTDGTFSFADVPPGEYTLEIVRIGFRPASITITVPVEEARVILISSPVTVPAVTVTGDARPEEIFTSPNAVTVLSGSELQKERGESIMHSLAHMPGVSLSSGSPLAVKPVVRGFTAQRIVVAHDGTRVEGQTWDEPQSTEVDAFDAERIEVVHGPLSLLFGPGAIGGVINIVRADLFRETAHLLDGQVELHGFSNNPQGAASVSLYGQQEQMAYQLTLTGRAAGDYSAPAGTTANGTHVASGSIFNSGAQEFNATARFGTKGEWGRMEWTYSHFGQFYTIAPEPGRKEYELNIHTNLYDSLPAAPKQEIFHEALAGKFLLPTGFGLADVTVGAQYDSRREEGVAESDADEKLKEEKGIKPEALLDLYTGTIDGRLHHELITGVDGTAGVSLIAQRNQTLGMNSVIPNYTSTTLSAFLYEEAKLHHTVKLTGGVRTDDQTMSVAANDSLRNAKTNLHYRSLNGSAGIVFLPMEDLSVAFTYGTGWRSPVASELFTRGKDEGTIRYKIGNASLVPELSHNVGMTLRFRSAMMQAEASLFHNAVNDFIYLDPTGTSTQGLPVFTYRQSNATLQGGEIFATIFVNRTNGIDLGFDFLESRNTTLKSPLPLQPANKVKAGLTSTVWESENGSGEGFSFRTVTVMVRGTNVFAQNKVTALERRTPEYALFDAAVSGDAAYDGHPFTFRLSAENLFNRAYYDHLSRYKEFALDPGINVTLKVSTPFTILP